MAKLRRLSGQDLLRILAALGFQRVSQRGSHIKLRRVLPGGARQNLTIVLHAELDKGTLHAIYRQALRYIPEAELRPHFYTQD
ncbi:MAG: type II toxin-antitoxin system HicA family toxin [Acidobacteria bacterium]|nr:type II toxin-antitoxin system HicA family toxin [Acidobacteriota bacterium]